MLQKYCGNNDIEITCKSKRHLLDDEHLEAALMEVANEAFEPLRDRIFNLAMPQKSKIQSKHMRLKIIISVLQYIVDNPVELSRPGIPAAAIIEGVDRLCRMLSEELIASSNLTQELGCLHEREETRETKNNLIPLFFFDKANKKLLVIEPTIYSIVIYSVDKMREIISELIDTLTSLKAKNS